MINRTMVTLIATIVTAVGAAVLATPVEGASMRQSYACGSTGGPPYLGCVAGETGCWLGAWGAHPETGEFGCWTQIMSGDNCCKDSNQT